MKIRQSYIRINYSNGKSIVVTPAEAKYDSHIVSIEVATKDEYRLSK